MADPASLYHTVKELISLRKVHPALQSTAGFRLIEDTYYPLVYERSCEEETILVVINVSDKEKQTAQDTSGSLLWSFDHELSRIAIGRFHRHFAFAVNHYFAPQE